MYASEYFRTLGCEFKIVTRHDVEKSPRRVVNRFKRYPVAHLPVIEDDRDWREILGDFLRDW